MVVVIFFCVHVPNLFLAAEGHRKMCAVTSVCIFCVCEAPIWRVLVWLPMCVCVCRL